MLYSSSRLSFIGLVFQLATYFLVLERRWHVRLAAVAGAVVAISLGTNMLMQSEFKLAEKLESAASNNYADGSIMDRLTLTANGIWMVVETNGRGVGAARYEERLGTGDVLIQRVVDKRGHKTSPPHNHWVEVLSEYGLVPFVAYMALLGWYARLAWQAWRRGEHRDVGRAIVVGLVGYLFYGVGSGSVLMQSNHWMFLATLAVLAAFLYEQGLRPRPSAATRGAGRT